MTSSREQRDMVEGYRLGVNSYIQKPIDFEQFQTIIKDLGYYWLVVNQSPPPEAFPHVEEGQSYTSCMVTSLHRARSSPCNSCNPCNHVTLNHATRYVSASPPTRHKVAASPAPSLLR